MGSAASIADIPEDKKDEIIKNIKCMLEKEESKLLDNSKLFDRLQCDVRSKLEPYSKISGDSCSGNFSAELCDDIEPSSVGFIPIEDFEKEKKRAHADKINQFRIRRLTYAIEPDKKQSDESKSYKSIITKTYSCPDFDALDNEAESFIVVPPFPIHIMGCFSYHGIEPTIIQNEDGSFIAEVAKINQDRGLILSPFNNSFSQALICVFDGHGSQGHLVSAYCATEIPSRLEKHPLLETQPQEAIYQVFVDVNASLQLMYGNKGGIDASFSGSTAVVMYVKESDVWMAHVGDSRGVIGRMVVKDDGRHNFDVTSLTCDHVLEVDDERKRVVSSGGVVSIPKLGTARDGEVKSRVWLDEAKTIAGLAMTRSIGDLGAKAFGVIAEPEIHHFKLTEQDKVIVLATDGVWEFISNDEAIETILVNDSVNGEKNADSACRALIDQASVRWRQEENEYRDDITAIVLFLPLWPAAENGKLASVEEQKEATG